MDKEGPVGALPEEQLHSPLKKFSAPFFTIGEKTEPGIAYLVLISVPKISLKAVN
jgi:hypothetical protein